MTSRAYAEAYNEVKRLGGDGVTTPNQTHRRSRPTPASSGPTTARRACAHRRGSTTRSRCTIADQMGTDVVDLARLLALVNVAMADAGIAIWESKYHYQFWRPVTGIREADAGTGPTGPGDGNPRPSATRLHAAGRAGQQPQGPNFTPPFPAYPSGHAAFGGALSRRCATSTGPTTSPSLSCPTNSTARRVDNEGNVAAAAAAHVHDALAGGGRERPEPDLSRHPLVVRQDRGHRAGPAHRELRLRNAFRRR